MIYVCCLTFRVMCNPHTLINDVVNLKYWILCYNVFPKSLDYDTYVFEARSGKSQN